MHREIWTQFYVKDSASDEITRLSGGIFLS